MIPTSLIGRAALVTCASAIIATVNLSALKAANLGGECCADLEERVAELEATTVRNGNRKVTVTISGQVHKALLVWDDGNESDVYVVDPTVWSTYIAVTGEGEVSDQITIGYALSIEPVDAASGDVAQNDQDDGDNTIKTDNANVFIEDKRLGRLTIGYASDAHDGVTAADVSGSGLVAAPAVTDWNGSFALVLAGSNKVTDITWFEAAPGDVGDGSTHSVVRYQTPDWNGLVLALSWGEDDISGVSARFDTEQHGFKLSSAIGFGDEADDSSPCTVDDLTEAGKCRTLAGSLSVLHLATGLSTTVAAGTIDDNNRRRFFPSLDSSDAWFYGKAGVVRNYFGIGGTAIYGEYYHSDRGVERMIDAALAGTTLSFVTSEVESDVWGVGVVQEIEDLGIETYASYRSYQAEIDGTSGGEPASLPIKDFNAFLIGMRVPF
jgi:hypothetical protein